MIAPSNYKAHTKRYWNTRHIHEKPSDKNLDVLSGIFYNWGWMIINCFVSGMSSITHANPRRVRQGTSCPHKYLFMSDVGRVIEIWLCSCLVFLSSPWLDPYLHSIVLICTWKCLDVTSIFILHCFFKISLFSFPVLVFVSPFLYNFTVICDMARDQLHIYMF